jgi:hypothetical protein
MKLAGLSRPTLFPLTLPYSFTLFLTSYKLNVTHSKQTTIKKEEKGKRESKRKLKTEKQK